MAVNCEVCGKADPWDTKYGTGVYKTQLLGGFSVDICNQCRNEWHEKVHTSEELSEYSEFVAHTETLRRAGKIRELEGGYAERREKQHAAYKLAKAWVCDHPKLPAPSERKRLIGPSDDIAVEDDSDDTLP